MTSEIKNVILVGLGNSGLPIAELLSKVHGVNLDGRDRDSSKLNHINKALYTEVRYNNESEPEKGNLLRLKVKDINSAKFPEKADLVIIATQDYSHSELKDFLKKYNERFSHRNTPILVLSNGIAEEFPDIKNLIKGAILFPSSHIFENGKPITLDFKRTKSGLANEDSLEIAKTYYNGEPVPEDILNAIEGLFSKAGLKVGFKQTKKDIEFDKLPEIVSMGLQAITGTKFSDAANGDSIVGKITSAMTKELHNVAEAYGKNFNKFISSEISENPTVKDRVDNFSGIPNSLEKLLIVARTRMERKGAVAGSLPASLVVGKDIELEAIYGRLIKMAEDKSIDVPYLKKIYQLTECARDQVVGKQNAKDILSEIVNLARDRFGMKEGQNVISAEEFLKIQPQEIMTEEYKALKKAGIDQKDSALEHN